MNPGVGGFIQKYGLFIGVGLAVFLGAFLLFGRKKAAATSSTGVMPGAVDANGQPITPTEFVPTTGDSYTNINYQSGNSQNPSTSTVTDINNSNDPTTTSTTTTTQAAPPPPLPPPHPPAPPDVDHSHDNDNPKPPDHDPGGIVTHLPPPPAVLPPKPPVSPPKPGMTSAQKAVSDWQTASNKKWTGPTGSFPFGWGPTPMAAGAGVINSGVFTYVVKP